MQQQSKAYPDKKNNQDIMHTSWGYHTCNSVCGTLQTWIFSRVYDPHPCAPLQAALLATNSFLEEKKIATKWVRLREFWKYQALERSVKFVINPWLADMLFNRHTITCMVRLWRYHTFVERYQLAFISTLNTTYIHVPVYINKCW